MIKTTKSRMRSKFVYLYFKDIKYKLNINYNCLNGVIWTNKNHTCLKMRVNYKYYIVAKYSLGIDTCIAFLLVLLVFQ